MWKIVSEPDVRRQHTVNAYQSLVYTASPALIDKLQCWLAGIGDLSGKPQLNWIRQLSAAGNVRHTRGSLKVNQIQYTDGFEYPDGWAKHTIICGVEAVALDDLVEYLYFQSPFSWSQWDTHMAIMEAVRLDIVGEELEATKIYERVVAFVNLLKPWAGIHAAKVGVLPLDLAWDEDALNFYRLQVSND